MNNLGSLLAKKPPLEWLNSRKCYRRSVRCTRLGNCAPTRGSIADHAGLEQSDELGLVLPTRAQCAGSTRKSQTLATAILASVSKRFYDVHLPKSNCFVSTLASFVGPPVSTLPAVGCLLPPASPAGGGDMRPDDAPTPGVCSLPLTERAMVRCLSRLICCNRSRQLLGNSLSMSLVCQQCAKTLALMANTRTNLGS
jgi:hypothetical protein